MPAARASAIRRGAELWCGMSDRESVSGWPAATGPPVAAMNISPSAGISRCSLSCGELSVVSPTFLTTTASCSSAAGSVCAISREPPLERIANATCTNVWPGANGPCTVTRIPLTLACGDDPSMIAVPMAPAGMSKANGAGGFTGTLWLLAMSSR